MGEAVNDAVLGIKLGGDAVKILSVAGLIASEDGVGDVIGVLTDIEMPRMFSEIGVYRAACETPGAFGLAQSSILLVNTHSPWIADWMPALEDRRHAERWK